MTSFNWNRGDKTYMIIYTQILRYVSKVDYDIFILLIYSWLPSKPVITVILQQENMDLTTEGDSWGSGARVRKFLSPVRTHACAPELYSSKKGNNFWQFCWHVSSYLTRYIRIAKLLPYFYAFYRCENVRKV